MQYFFTVWGLPVLCIASFFALYYSPGKLVERRLANRALVLVFLIVILEPLAGVYVASFLQLKSALHMLSFGIISGVIGASCIGIGCKLVGVSKKKIYL